MQNGYELLAELRAETLDMFDVPNSLLPSEYHTKKGYRSLASVDKQYEKTHAKRDGREVSVKFSDGKEGREIVESTPERLAMVEHYRKQFVDGVEDFEPFGGLNEMKLYRAELNFAATLIRAGIMEPFDDDNGFDEE
jgi:hypothetical protein